MPGYLLLEGGAEFGGAMAEPDQRALELAGGADASVAIIPAAAAPDHNHQRAGMNGQRWFQSLGARRVSVVPLIDRASAANERVVAQLRAAQLIYLLGGFTHYLGQVLAGSLAWEAVLEAYADGAVIAGSSAGAMVLTEVYYDPMGGRTEMGLNLIPGCCVIPHHDTFGKKWAPRLRELLPAATLIGIDEQTGMLFDEEAGGWRVYGRGSATLYSIGTNPRVHFGGETFTLED
jgi:cyanophycinase